MTGANAPVMQVSSGKPPPEPDKTGREQLRRSTVSIGANVAHACGCQQQPQGRGSSSLAEILTRAAGTATDRLIIQRTQGVALVDPTFTGLHVRGPDAVCAGRLASRLRWSPGQTGAGT
jgi:hypothetical protein